MSTLYFLIPLGLLLFGIAIAAFFWAVGHGQFDDLDTPPLRALLDDDRHPDGREVPPKKPDSADAPPD